LVFNVIDAHFRYSSGHYAPWSLHSIQNVSVTHACLWCYTDTPVSPSIELAKYHNITEILLIVKSNSHISYPFCLFLSFFIRFWKCSDRIVFFFILYYPLKNITTFLQVKKTQNQIYCRLITITTQNQYGYYDNTSYYSSYNT
jgi:hypothetical protein